MVRYIHGPGGFTMSRTMLVLALLLALVPGRPVLAGPPEGVSGRMVLDKVVEGLMRYRHETDLDKRWDRLGELARTRDPRVAVVLGDLLDHGTDADQQQAAVIFIVRYHGQKGLACLTGIVPPVHAWWKKNEADLRRRAKQLP
jgi:hypothetical protein